MKNILVIISSAIVSSLILFVSRSNPNPTLEGLIGGLWIIPTYFIGVPLLFGVITFAANKSFKSALASVAISFTVAILVFIAFAFWTAK